MNKQTITILDHQTNETRTIEAEGYALLAVAKRSENGFASAQAVDAVNSKEVAQMILALEQEFPSIRKARLKEKIGGAVGEIIQGMLTDKDDCDCENCVARREKEAQDAPNAN